MLALIILTNQSAYAQSKKARLMLGVGGQAGGYEVAFRGESRPISIQDRTTVYIAFEGIGNGMGIASGVILSRVGDPLFKRDKSMATIIIYAAPALISGNLTVYAGPSFSRWSTGYNGYYYHMSLGWSAGLFLHLGRAHIRFDAHSIRATIEDSIWRNRIPLKAVNLTAGLGFDILP